MKSLNKIYNLISILIVVVASILLIVGISLPLGKNGNDVEFYFQEYVSSSLVLYLLIFGLVGGSILANYSSNKALSSVGFTFNLVSLAYVIVILIINCFQPFFDAVKHQTSFDIYFGSILLLISGIILFVISLIGFIKTILVNKKEVDEDKDNQEIKE